MFRIAVAAAALTAAFIIEVSGARAEIGPGGPPKVSINGQTLSAEEVAMLERVSCGPVAAGAYWVDAETGIWGRVGAAAPLGHMEDRCRAAAPAGPLRLAAVEPR